MLFGLELYYSKRAILHRGMTPELQKVAGAFDKEATTGSRRESPSNTVHVYDRSFLIVNMTYQAIWASA